MIENIEQAKKHLKEIIDFYKLNDENNYDYPDNDLISIRIVLKEIERLNNGLKDIKWYIEKNKTSFSDLYIPASDVVSILVIIDRLLGSDKE